MSTAIEQARTSWQGVEMSVEEFLTLPDDGTHRELDPRESCEELGHDNEESISQLEIVISDRSKLLANWMDLQPEPRGEVVGGEAGFWLKRDQGISRRNRCGCRFC